MANIYVRSTDGSNSNNGSTWALAKLDLVGAAAIDAAGDTIYVSNNHAETTAATINPVLAGTGASPVKLICVDDSTGEPPTTSASSATITTTGTSNISMMNAGSSYVQGVKFYVGSGTGAASFNASGNSTSVHFKDCHIELVATGNGSIQGGGNPVAATFTDCTYKFSAETQGFSRSFSPLIIEGGSLASGGTSPTAFIKAGINHTTCFISGLDLSNANAAINLVAGNNIGTRSVWRNCRLPASWSGSLASGTLAVRERHEMHNCDSADTNYRLGIRDYSGDITQSTSVYNDAGATDGTTRISWAMASGANAEGPHLGLVSPEIVQWNETTGSAVTVTVEIVHNSQGSGANGVLNDDEIWLEVMSLSTSGVPLGTWSSDRKSDWLASASAQTASSASWTGDSAGWDTQKLEVTITPQEKGYIHARVVLAKASSTVYVDPKLTVA